MIIANKEAELESNLHCRYSLEAETNETKIVRVWKKIEIPATRIIFVVFALQQLDQPINIASCKKTIAQKNYNPKRLKFNPNYSPLYGQEFRQIDNFHVFVVAEGVFKLILMS